jgi:hypothetical protein
MVAWLGILITLLGNPKLSFYLIDSSKKSIVVDLTSNNQTKRDIKTKIGCLEHPLFKCLLAVSLCLNHWLTISFSLCSIQFNLLQILYLHMVHFTLEMNIQTV